MVALAPGGPPMSRRVDLSHLDMPKGDFQFWHVAKFCCNAKLCRNRGKANLAGPAVDSAGSRLTLRRHEGRCDKHPGPAFPPGGDMVIFARASEVLRHYSVSRSYGITE
jgi:hypothetical protein